MGIDYTEVIVESGAQSGRCERRLRGQAKGARVRMLRLLKGGQATSLPACFPLVGYSLRQLRRWWAEYKESGLVGLIEEKPHPGKASKLSDAAYEALQVQMRLGKIATRSGRPRIPGAGAQHPVRLGERGMVAATQAQGEAQDRQASAQTLGSRDTGGVQKRTLLIGSGSLPYSGRGASMRAGSDSRYGCASDGARMGSVHRGCMRTHTSGCGCMRR